ncbi:MAG: hypothetical protein QGG73_10930, partial [Candidatus Hydrogenedentes bacterium]|nr:hypothetical protein [Candidatus Hydrogenedentota bacterium]
HFWLITPGLIAFMVTLWAAGLIQGENWNTGGIPFIETVMGMKPYMFIRLLAGAAMGAGIAVFLYNTLLSLRAKPAPAPVSERAA